MDVDLPGIYIDRIVQATVDKKIELLTLHEEDNKGEESDSSVGSTDSKKASAHERRVRIARRAAKEVSLTFLVSISYLLPLPDSSMVLQGIERYIVVRVPKGTAFG
jgi:3-oxoacid CoA-transferase